MEGPSSLPDWGMFNASFRSLESYMMIFKEILGIPRISYSSIFKRIRKIRVPEIMNSSSSVAIDSTSFKTTIRGDWMSNKWKKKRRVGSILYRQFCTKLDQRLH